MTSTNILWGTVMAFIAPPPKPPIVTVWIHGTRPQEFLPTKISEFTEKMENNLFSCKLGLHKASDLDLQYYQYSVAKELAVIDPEQFPWEHFYLFGWSGKLDPEARKNSSYELFCALKDLCLCYEKKIGSRPKINIITHSHGGNIALGMAAIKDLDGFILSIDKLILLACPVQQYTQDLIKANTFARIYSIHSHSDMIQVLDPQGLHPFFGIKSFSDLKAAFEKCCRPLLSQRHFPVHPKVIQAQINWKNGIPWIEINNRIDSVYLKPIKNALKKLDRLKKKRGLLHIEFKLLPFIRLLPTVLKQLDVHIQKNTHCISNADPDILIYI